MAISRGGQRGVIHLASVLVLAAFALLLGATGCSAGAAPEATGQVSEAAVICTCPKSNACLTYPCNPPAGSTCAAAAVASADLTDCSDAAGVGVCVSGSCCRTCWRPGFRGYICAAAIDGANCAVPGKQCTSCTGASGTCEVNTCDANGACAVQTLKDGTTCTDQSGACYKGSCCAGCIDGNGVCQGGTETKRCGVSGVNGLAQCADCTDSDACTTDVCKEGTCAHGAQPDNTPCADNTKCNGDEVCVQGKCQGPVNFMCPVDNNPCHAPICDAVTGCSQKLLNNVGCSDGNKCNGAEMCVAGTCTAGTAPNCDDNNPCTADSCDAVQGCVHTTVAPGTNCDDGNLCNGISTCVGSVCTAGAALNCDDNNVCTTDSCVPATGCKFVNNTADCSDNNVCTTNDKCDGAGKCKGGAAPNCDDNEACTTDTCDPARGCLHAAVMDGGNCDDGNDCSTGDKCVAGKCKASGGKLCDDLNPCTQNTCDPQNGSMCAYPAETNGTPCTFDKCHQNSSCQAGKCDQGDAIDCDDANPCTTDSCDPATGCKHVADNAPACSDGDLCTKADHCKSGVCIGTDVTCTAFDECHEAGTCNADTGVCDDPRSDDGKQCTGGHCQSGKCVLDPAGEGGAGGETGTGGDGTITPEGGAPTGVGMGGEGNEPTSTGGEPPTGGGNGGKSGNASGGSTTTEGGAAEIPEHAFVRNPGGCSCSVPASRNAGDLTGLAALAVGVGVVARGRRRRAWRRVA